MSQKATAIYDFDGIPDNGEISLREGDIVTVLKRDVGDGWWEGMTPSGESGLFPESYVELIHEENGVTVSSDFVIAIINFGPRVSHNVGKSQSM